mmetsp:Transcript_3955/g.5757  ORF Transcript_3955/g.5757 Transcript_3955/m.5757 type:complete len:309 (-) Transcript_3955:182-1108(-)
MILGDYQSTSSMPYIVGTISAWVLCIGSITWMVTMGRRNNSKYKYSPGFRWPKAVFLWRFCVMAYCLTILFKSYSTKLGPQGHSKAWGLGYFTAWSWIMVNLYFIASFGVSVFRVFWPDQVPVSVHSKEMGTVFVVDPQPRNRLVYAFMTAQQVAGSIICPGSIVISLCVWGMFAPDTHWDDQFVSFMSISQHACNTFFMFSDFMVAGWTVNPRHWALSITYGTFYCAFHLIMNAEYGMMAYPFMQTNKPIFLAYLYGISVSGCLTFTLYWALSKLKLRYNTVPSMETYSGDSKDNEDKHCDSHVLPI